MGLLDAGKRFEECLPLDIVSDEKDNVPSSYKEKWDLDNSIRSLEQLKVYEAGAVMFWANPIPQQSGTSGVPCQDLSYTECKVLAQTMFLPVVLKSGGAYRIIPQLLECYQDAGVTLVGFPKDLQLLGGHGYVCGWFLLYHEAVLADDKDMQKMLIEAALCTTIRLRIMCSEGEVAAASIHASNISTLHSLHSDTFRVFAWKVCLILEEQKKARAEANVNQKAQSQAMQLSWLCSKWPELAFNGSKMNKTMLGAVLAMNSLFPQGSAAAKDLELIDRRHGREIMGTYSRNYKFAAQLVAMFRELSQTMQGCEGIRTNAESEFAATIVCLILWDLDRGWPLASEFGDKWLFGDEEKKKSSSKTAIGWIHTRSACLAIVNALRRTGEQAKVSAFTMLCIFNFPDSFSGSHLRFSEATLSMDRKLSWIRIVLEAVLSKSITTAFNTKRIQS